MRKKAKLNLLSIILAWIILFLHFRYQNPISYFTIGLFVSVGINHLVMELLGKNHDMD